MAKAIQILLRQDVENLGSAGEVVRVRPGYARNYLIPRGLGLGATRASIQQIEQERKAALALAAKHRAQAEGIAAALAEISIEIAKPAGSEGRLFGSVTAADIATELQAKGYEVERKQIVMPESVIKTVGEYDIQVKLTSGVSGTFKLQVTAKA